MSTGMTAAAAQPSTSYDITTETENAIAKRCEQFDKRFAPIWKAFRNAKPLSAADERFLRKEFVSAEDYLHYSDAYIFRPGVELINNRIALLYLPSAPHEAVAHVVSLAVDRSYDCFPGGNLIDIGSLFYLPNLEKQPDASFRHRNMPAPNRQNKLMYQPGTQKHFPTVVVEVTYRNETSAQLSSDALAKYFNATTSVQLWIGFKINHNNSQQQMTFFGI